MLLYKNDQEEEARQLLLFFIAKAAHPAWWLKL